MEDSMYCRINLYVHTQFHSTPTPRVSDFECQPLLTESDGILYDLAYGRVDPEVGSCDRVVRDILGDGF